MEKTVIKFVTGLSANASSWEKRQARRYGGKTSVCRQIGYDIKHGATIEQVFMLLQKIRNDSSFTSLQKNDDSGKIKRARQSLSATKGRKTAILLMSVHHLLYQ
jgi:hypothetical protein